ncbi:hypothetical protein WKI13_09235 [Teredinibacter turnerae]|nr:hypothetical protein [Teredinibacter turnerae]
MLYPLFGSPRLPKIEKSEARKLRLSGTSMQFAVPPFYIEWGRQRDWPDTFDIYDSNAFCKTEEQTAFLKCFESKWDLKGLPVWKTELGWIEFSITVFKLSETGSAFNLRKFESDLLDQYVRLYGPMGRFNKHSFETFLNWSPQLINGSLWVSYHGRKHSVSDTSYQLVWETPITDEHMISVTFSYQNYKEKKTVHYAVEQFAQKIMTATHLDLSPSAQEQKSAAEKQWPNQKYSEHMEPLRWIRPKKDFISVEEYFADDDT